MRVVFDTNVLLAAFLTEGLCAKLLARARRRQFHLVLCPVILAECKRILSKKFKANHEELAPVLSLPREFSQSVVTPDTVVRGICRDRDDDLVLDCARAAQAAFLVTGDADLLVLGEFEAIRIINPRDFEGMMEG